MFVLPKSFEHTLRSPIVPATPNNPGSGLNPAFHKGCIGKAHACGTMKSKLNKPIPPPRPDRWPRKNSISSETISESGSDKSTRNSQPISNGGCSTPEDQVTTKKYTTENVLYISKRNNSHTTSPLPSKRNKAAAPQPPSMLNRMASIRSTQRMRLHSEGDKSPECSSSTLATTFERTQKNRSFRLNKSNVSSKTGTPPPPTSSQPSNIRPPWNSAAAGAKSPSPSTTLISNRIFRSSLRRRNDAVPWQTLWERSMQMRGSTASCGLYKNYDEAIKMKVC